MQRFDFYLSIINRNAGLFLKNVTFCMQLRLPLSITIITIVIFGKLVLVNLRDMSQTFFLDTNVLFTTFEYENTQFLSTFSNYYFISYFFGKTYKFVNCLFDG